MDYYEIICEKFSNCNVEVIQTDFLEPEKLLEYITDDIIVYNPHSVIIYRHMIRFLMNNNAKGKIYYLKNFSDENLKIIHAGLLKFTWESDTKINLYKNADPDKDVLGLG